MLLQVHDELVFEAPPEELDECKGTCERADGRCLRIDCAAAGGSGHGAELERCEMRTTKEADGRGRGCGTAYPLAAATKNRSGKPSEAAAQYKVRMQTTKGDVVILVHRDWARWVRTIFTSW